MSIYTARIGDSDANRYMAMYRGAEWASMLDAPQLCFLYDLAVQAPDGAACEVGVAHGGSFAAWSLARVGRGNLYGVDNWYGRESKRKKHFARMLAQYDISCTTICDDSWAAAAQIKEPLAFCFVDACHGDEGISRDVPAYTALIMVGGIIVFHDYDTDKCPAVKARVDEWQARAGWDYLGVVGSAIAYRRNR